MPKAVPCPKCGSSPHIEQDSAGLQVRAWAIWCLTCERAAKGPPPQRVFMARALTIERVIGLWNKNAGDAS